MGHTNIEALSEVGPRLRVLRRANALALADLAADTGPTSSTRRRSSNRSRIGAMV